MFYYKSIETKNKKVFFLYTLLITLLVIAVVITRYILDSYSSYYIVVRVYNVIEYSALAYLFFLYIKSKLIRTALLYSIIPYTLFCIFDFITAKEPTLALVPLIIEYIVLLLFIVYFFFEVMQQTIVEPIYQKAIFWISVAFIINFSGNFFLLLSSLNSFNNETFRNTFIVINGSVTILKNIFLCIAVVLKENNNDNQVLKDLSIDSELDSFLSFKRQN